MQKVTTCLWFDDQGEAAAKFYVSLFKNSKILSVSRYGDSGRGKKGSVMTVAFRLAGRDFIALNGGPIFEFSPAISLSVSCKDQREVDTLWRKLLKGGKESRCGWLEDRYGLSWQIVPDALPKMLRDRNPKRAARVMKAMLEMKKIVIKTLERARDAA